MIHYVYLRLKNKGDLLADTKVTLNKAKAAISGLLSFQVLKQEILKGDELNMLVVLSFDNAQSLDAYLLDPLHTEFLQLLKPFIIEKAVFDDKN